MKGKKEEKEAGRNVVVLQLEQLEGGGPAAPKKGGRRLGEAGI